MKANIVVDMDSRLGVPFGLPLGRVNDLRGTNSGVPAAKFLAKTRLPLVKQQQCSHNVATCASQRVLFMSSLLQQRRYFLSRYVFYQRTPR